jgi:hypothetical protein
LPQLVSFLRVGNAQSVEVLGAAHLDKPQVAEILRTEHLHIPASRYKAPRVGATPIKPVH